MKNGHRADRFCFAMAVTASLLLQADGATANPRETPATHLTQAQFDARMAWWREARFGVFVHWGLYSAAEGYWNGKPVYGSAEWIERDAEVPSDVYAASLLPRFKPKPGFASAWARLAKEAGAKYLVFTDKHHDGFALHNSAATAFDAMDATGRDLAAEIIAATRGEGLKVGVYYSQIDWHHPAYPYRALGDLPHPLAKLPADADPGYTSRVNLPTYQDYLQAQVREITTAYGRLDILWWDYSNDVAQGPTWRADELMAMVRRNQPHIVMNNRLFNQVGFMDTDGKSLKAFDRSHGDFTTPEQAVPASGMPGVDWETCMTMNDTWGFSRHDQHWKSTRSLVRTLVDAASKGGNFLLNIGPRADGSIPDESVTRLREMGAWMRVNGESIYGTTASSLGAMNWGRITAKGDTLYLHVFQRPADGIVRLPLASVAAASLLDGGQSLELASHADGMTEVKLPFRLADPIDTVVRLRGVVLER